jgi:hypothetical protein
MQPILAIVTKTLISRFNLELIDNQEARKTVTRLAGLIFLLGFAIAGMGAMIAAGYRFALEAGIA